MDVHKVCDTQMDQAAGQVCSSLYFHTLIPSSLVAHLGDVGNSYLYEWK